MFMLANPKSFWDLGFDILSTFNSIILDSGWLSSLGTKCVLGHKTIELLGREEGGLNVLNLVVNIPLLSIHSVE